MEQRGRLWLVAGIVLVIVAVLSNAPGLDTTLLLSVDEDGQAPWGSARTVDPLANDPNSSTALSQAVWLGLVRTWFTMKTAQPNGAFFILLSWVYPLVTLRPLRRFWTRQRSSLQTFSQTVL